MNNIKMVIERTWHEGANWIHVAHNICSLGWGFYEYNNEHKRGGFRGWATVIVFMSVSSVDDSWIKSNFLGQWSHPLLWAG